MANNANYTETQQTTNTAYSPRRSGGSAKQTIPIT